MHSGTASEKMNDRTDKKSNGEEGMDIHPKRASAVNRQNMGDGGPVLAQGFIEGE